MYGEFTGAMVGMTCADRGKHEHYADFDFYEIWCYKKTGIYGKLNK